MKWNMDTEYIQSCNCAYGCPCNFNGLPTHGNCEAFVGYKVRKGAFGDTKLDGVTFAWALWWPKAIHEGHGTGRVYIDTAASPAQAKAIEEITSGKHGGGVFEVFPKTFAKTLPTKRAKIDWKYGDYVASFKVEGVGEVQSDYILNPITGEKFEGEVILPGGIGFKKSVVSRIKKVALHDADFQFDHKDTSGFTTRVKFTEKGPS
ncbi:MAG: DUF1326 domain-containing protein [Thermoplasmata archaeon]|nr:DUF1326 domain-containing protein [Thermoplasmata archaeon]